MSVPPLRLLPASLERCEVPALAMPADDPQSPFGLVVGEAAAHGEVLDDLVAAEIVIAEETVARPDRSIGAGKGKCLGCHESEVSLCDHRRVESACASRAVESLQNLDRKSVV